MERPRSFDTKPGDLEGILPKGRAASMYEPKKGPVESAPIIASCAAAERSTGFADWKS